MSDSAMRDPTLSTVDPRLAELIRLEERRQHDKFRLIPSEISVSRAVL